MNLRTCAAFLLLLLTTGIDLPTLAQNANQFNYNILGSEILVAGSFGELRSDHLHSGLDFKTNGRQGVPVYAFADGFVSRVKVSSGGFGRVIYLQHDGNLTTVYAHLSEFYNSVQDTVDLLQNKKHLYEVELFPTKDRFPVKKGQLIGYSGNSGGSEGPHLHFETRHTESEKPFDPVSLGFNLHDSIPPVVRRVLVYSHPKGLIAKGETSIYSLELKDDSDLTSNILRIPDQNFFIGFEGYDLSGNGSNKLGIKTINLYVDSQAVFNCSIDSFSFGDTRMVNALTDPCFQTDQSSANRLCMKMAGNHLPFYHCQDGLIHAKKNKVYQCQLEVFDNMLNKTTILFNIQVDNSMQVSKPAFIKAESSFLAQPGKAQIYTNNGFSIEILSNSILQNTLVETVGDSIDSGVLFLYPECIQINKPLTVSMKIPDNLINQASKLLITRVGEENKLAPLTSKLEKNGWISASTGKLGKFKIMADRQPPETGKPYFRKNDRTGKNELIIPVKDNLSGITSYECYYKRRWQCIEYQSLTGELILQSSKSLQKRKIRIKILLTDKTGNSSKSKFTIMNKQRFD